MSTRAETEHTAVPDTTVLIPAAGMGERLGLGPKARLELGGRPLLSWLGEKMLRLSDEVVVAVPQGYVDEFSDLCPGCTCIEGGVSRQQSVERLLDAATRDYVVVTDAARPFASLALCRAVIKAARNTGAAGSFLSPDVPVAQIENNRVVQSFRRDEVGVFQAPQAFDRALLGKVLAQSRAQQWQEQSTLQLVLRAGIEVCTVPGEKQNIKLTTMEDWQLAQQFTEYLL